MAKTITVRLPNYHKAQKQIRNESRRFNVVDCGIRFGKSLMGTRLLIEPALEGYPVAWYAPTYKMLEEVWRDIRGRVGPIVSRSDEQMNRLDLITGGVIEMWSLEKDPDASRGRKYKRVIIDEAAKIGKLQYAWEHVIRGRLMDYEGDAWFLSTPKGYNYFRTLYAQAEYNSNEWASWQMPTSKNPYIKPTEIEAARKILPERVFTQEYLAEFIPDGSYFQNVDACCVLTVPDNVSDHPGHTFCLGLDWGKSNDYTSGTVGCRECDKVVDWFKFNAIDYTAQRGRIKQYVDKWPDCRVLPERNSIGEPNIEMLREMGMEIALGPDLKQGFMTTETTKPTVIEMLYLALQRGKQYPKEYAEEFRAYEVSTGANGRPRFGAPEGMHDDCVMSAAMENYLAMSALQIF